MSVTNELDIKIKANSDKATTSLDGLISKLNEVNTALNGLNTDKINQISESIKGIKGVHLNTGGIKGISNSDAGNTVNNSNKMSNSFKTLLSAINGSNKGLLNFRGTMVKMAATWGTFYAAMYPVIRLFKFFGSKVGDAMDYTETFNYFKVTMNKIGHDAGEQFVNGFTLRLNDLNKALTGFRLGKNGELFETGDKNLGLDPEILMQFQAKIGAVTNSVGLLGRSANATQKALSMLSSDLSSLKNEDVEDVMTHLSSGLIGQSRALYRYGIDITNATLKQYAYQHGITKSVSAMTQSEKMQLRVLAILQQSQVAWGDQANTISSVANQYRILKQQISNLGRVIGNLFLPLIQTVIPYLNAFVIAMRRVLTLLGMKFHGDNWLADLTDGVSEGNFSGLEEEIEDTEDAINDATKAAKKFKQATMGFDELNIISPQTQSGSGSGSGGGGGFDLSDDIEDALDEYEKVWDEAFKKMQNKAEDIADKFMSYVEAKNWFGLGDWLGGSLAKNLASIPWDDVYAGAKNFGRGLADFLNGLISPDLFYQVGRTIAGSLNTVLYAFLSFGESFEFYDLGVSIGNGINGFFQEYDFSALADTLNTWIDGIEDIIGGAIETISWTDVFKGLYDFFSNLEIDTITLIISAKALKNIVFMPGFKKTMMTMAAEKIGKISLPQLAVTFLKLSPSFAGTVSFDVIAFKILAEIDGAFSRLLPSFSTGLGEDLKGAIFGALGGMWGGAALGFAGGPVGAIIGSFATALKQAIPTAFDFDWTREWFKKATDSFKKIANTEWYNLVEIGSYIFEGVVEGFVGAFGLIFEPIAKLFGGIWESFAQAFGIHSPAEKMKPLGAYIFLGVVEGFKAKFSEWKKAIEDWYTNDVKPWFAKDKWLALGDGIKKGLSNKWSDFATWWENTGFYNWWNDDVSPWFEKEVWLNFGDTMKTSLTNKWNDFAEWWSTTGIFNWWHNDVVPWFDEKNWSFDGIKKGLMESFNRAIIGIKTVWNAFADWVNDKLSWDIPTIKLPNGNTIGGMRIELGKLPRFDIPKYAIGGFPEDGLFMANHGELVGQFSNGQTAVANNEQIVEGIKSGVASAVAQTLAPYLRDIVDNTRETANNTDDIAKKPVQTFTDRGIAKANIRGQRSLGLQLRTT